MKKVALTAEKRESGKGVSRRLRFNKRIPAVLYGKSVDPLAISVDWNEMEKLVKGEAGMNVMVDLSIAGADSGLALIRDYQADPFKRNFTHIDFQAITMSDQLEVEVPIDLVGKSIGVKEGGVLEQMRRTIHIKALPDKIPSKLEVDISELNIGDSIHADEVQLPEGVDFPHTANYTIVAVVPPTKIEEVVAVPVEGEEGVEGEAPAEGEEGAAEAKEGEAKKEGAEAKPGGKKE